MIALTALLMTCMSHIFPETCAWNYDSNSWSCEKDYPKHDGLPYSALDTLRVVRNADGSVSAVRTLEGKNGLTTSVLASIPAAVCTGNGVNCESPDRSQGLYLIEVTSTDNHFILERRQGSVRSELGVYQICQ